MIWVKAIERNCFRLDYEDPPVKAWITDKNNYLRLHERGGYSIGQAPDGPTGLPIDQQTDLPGVTRGFYWRVGELLKLGKITSTREPCWIRENIPNDTTNASCGCSLNAIYGCPSVYGQPCRAKQKI